MASENSHRGKKRSKAFYRKSAYGGKRQCTGRNILEPGIRGFLVMCHSNESSAVRESYNILNEYGDLLYGPDKRKPPAEQQTTTESPESGSDSDDDCEDVEKALQKEVNSIKNVVSTEKRFQNVATKAKNLVFIRTTLEDPVKVVTTVMEDIATRNLKRARFAARMLPIVATCKAQTATIAELAKSSLASYFSKDNPDVPSSFTVMFKARNNNGTTCGKDSVIPAVKNEILAINPDLKFSWSEFDVAILVEVVCTTCCLGLAPGYHRLRKYNIQELAQGPRTKDSQPAAIQVEFLSQEQRNKDSSSANSPAESTHQNKGESKDTSTAESTNQDQHEIKGTTAAESSLHRGETETPKNTVMESVKQGESEADIETRQNSTSTMEMTEDTGVDKHRQGDNTDSQSNSQTEAAASGTQSVQTENTGATGEKTTASPGGSPSRHGSGLGQLEEEQSNAGGPARLGNVASDRYSSLEKSDVTEVLPVKEGAVEVENKV